MLDQTCIELFDLYRSGKIEEAQKLQLQVSAAEAGLAKGGINGTKWAVAKFLRYPESSAVCRRPYPLFTDPAKREMITSKMLLLQDVEARLTKRG